MAYNGRTPVPDASRRTAVVPESGLSPAEHVRRVAIAMAHDYSLRRSEALTHYLVASGT